LRWIAGLFSKIPLLDYFLKDQLLVSLITLAIPKSSGRYYYENNKWNIDFGYFNDRSDLEDLKEGLRENRKNIKERLNLIELSPSGEITDDLIKKSAGTTYHLTGTCRMGKDESDSVVSADDNCKVHGTKNVYVFGAAAFPNPIRTSNSVVCAAISLISINNIFGFNHKE
jgi:choline dehydrogenase-like flavoprotein